MEILEVFVVVGWSQRRQQAEEEDVGGVEAEETRSCSAEGPRFLSQLSLGKIPSLSEFLDGRYQSEDNIRVTIVLSVQSALHYLEIFTTSL